MTRSTLLGTVVLLMCVALPAVAQDSAFWSGTSQSDLSPTAQLAAAQAKLIGLRSQVQQTTAGDHLGHSSSPADCECYCDTGCGGWYGGAELVLVKPHTSRGSERLLAINTNNNVVFGRSQEPTFDYAATPRLYLGYRNRCGTGGRVRYWKFDESSDVVDLDPTNNQFDAQQEHMDVRVLDFEGTQLVCWGPLQADCSAGLRYAKVDLDSIEIGQFPVAWNSDFEGWGPTFAMDARFPIGCGALSAFGNMRASFLYGDRKTMFHLAALAEEFFDEKNTMINAFESQFGLQYQRCAGGGVLTARAALEGQYWHNPISAFVGTWGTDLAFLGGSFSIEYSR